MILLASLISLSSSSRADDCDCKAADEVIQKQDYLIKLMGKRNEDLFNQLIGLQGELVKTQLEEEHNRNNGILWGVIGVALGAIAASAVHK